MRNKSHFRNTGRGVTFTCMICERRTRMSGQDVDHLCSECYEIAGMDNVINDGCDAETAADCRAECERLLAKAMKLRSNGEAIKKANSFVWPSK